MFHWFTWRGKNSLADFGLWIGKLPKFQRAQERYANIQIPGRAGSLILLEGDDVYEDYQLEVTVITRNRNPKIQASLAWLSGDGELCFSNEGEMVHEARIINVVEYARIGNDLLQGKIQFLCAPFRKRLHPYTITLTASRTIYNPGDVASRPIVKITATGDRAITIGGQTMTFANLSGTVVVDCDAGIVTKDGDLWTGSVTGDYWRIPTGAVTVTLPSSTSIEIQPEWRWK